MSDLFLQMFFDCLWVLSLFFVLIYFLLVSLMAYRWHKIPKKSKEIIENQVFISVIIPVRDEAANIVALLADLSGQDYDNFEVIVVDDDSQDNTFELVSDFLKNNSLKIKLLKLDQSKVKTSHKKAAIRQAIEQAEGELIVTTDGDCRVGRSWLSSYNAHYQQYKSDLISAPVCLSDDGTFFGSCQQVEFASLLGTGAASMSLGLPNMANGANLAYRKSVFEAVGGFEGTEHIASGDDEFLLHKIFVWGGRIHFAKDKNLIVRTQPLKTLSLFYQQRKRWASKWRYYRQLSTILTAVGVFVFHLLYVLLFVGMLLGFLEWELFLGLYFFRFLAEFVFLALVLDFVDQSSKAIFIPIVAIFYSFYVVLVAVAGSYGAYRWKGRRL